MIRLVVILLLVRTDCSSGRMYLGRLVSCSCLCARGGRLGRGVPGHVGWGGQFESLFSRLFLLNPFLLLLGVMALLPLNLFHPAFCISCSPGFSGFSPNIPPLTRLHRKKPADQCPVGPHALWSAQGHSRPPFPFRWQNPCSLEQLLSEVYSTTSPSPAASDSPHPSATEGLQRGHALSRSLAQPLVLMFPTIRGSHSSCTIYPAYSLTCNDSHSLTNALNFFSPFMLPSTPKSHELSLPLLRAYLRRGTRASLQSAHPRGQATRHLCTVAPAAGLGTLRGSFASFPKCFLFSLFLRDSFISWPLCSHGPLSLPSLVTPEYAALFHQGSRPAPHHFYL